MSEVLTIPSPETGSSVNGYIVIAPLSEESKYAIYKMQSAIQSRFPEHKFWFPKGEQLHITFAHILTPNVTYPEGSKVLWEHIGSQALDALRATIPRPFKTDVSFDVLDAFPTSIILKGHDDGTYGKLRQDFVRSFALPDESRRPPNIIHTTVARFYDEIELRQVQEYVSSLKPKLIETTTELQVIHETGLYVYKHAILERIPAT